jgi:tRNA A-37 threonylcarbamoyl transferase component Bud32
MTNNFFGKYEILDKIGQGAMGEVYRARDASLNRELALKTINRETSADEMLRKRFRREAQSAAGLSHPNIITVYDFGQEQDRLFMAMELLQGSDLKAVIARKELTTLDAKLAVMEQIADGLAFAHSRGVVHRDLKPANIHVQPGGQVKIVDFGLAHVSGSDMTRTGMVMGTPHYMSPEQVRGEKVDTRSDVFSLGCIFYELLAGQRPFDAESMHSVLFKVLQEEPRSIRELSPDVPVVLVQVVERALAKDSAARFADGTELSSALRRAHHAVQSGQGHVAQPELGATLTRAPRAVNVQASAATVGSRSDAAQAPKRSPLLPILVGATLLLLALGGGLLLIWKGLGPSSPAPSPSQNSAVDQVAEALAGTQLELARKKLDAGDYREAERQAQRAAKLAPQNAEIQELLRDAHAIVERVDQAAKQIRSAETNGDANQVVAALWDLMQVDPDHALVVEHAPRHEAQFADQATRAKARMQQARAVADKGGAAQLDDFKSGTSLAKDADVALHADKDASASRLFCAAALRFERARRLVSQ